MPNEEFVRRSDVMEDGRKYLVYLLRFPNGKIYIGMTSKTVRKRYYLKDSHNEELREIKSKYKFEEIYHDILGDGLTRAEASKIEKSEIARHNSTNPNVGYNVSPGGVATFAGMKHTEQAKEKIRAANVGKIVSAETRSKASLSHKGKNVGEKNYNYRRKKTPEEIQKQYDSHRSEMKPIVMCDEFGNKVVEYDSIHQASKGTGQCRRSIKRSAETGKITQNTIWKYK